MTLSSRLTRLWDYWSWGPLYFVRRLICHVWGHDEAWDHSTPEGGYFCCRCMEGT